MKHTFNTGIATLLMTVPGMAFGAGVLHADDSVAGYGTDIDLTGFAPQSAYMLVITPPLGPSMEAPVTTNKDGNANLHIPGQETEVAGMYDVILEAQGVPVDVRAAFEILPDGVSLQQSVIEVQSDTVVADGKQDLGVTVILRDRYGNPLQGKPVSLISSRSVDHISSDASATDGRGEQRFRLRTAQPGVLSLRAIDLISGTLLSGDITITATNGSGVGGPSYASLPPAMSRGVSRPPSGNTYSQPYAANVLGSPWNAQTVQYGLVDHFEITIEPEQPTLNQDATISIRAVDQAGIKVEDYDGMAYLYSTDKEAFLPLDGDVKFRPQDLGEKTLTLGLRFRTSGEPVAGMPPTMSQHVLGVADDLDNPRATGQITVTVIDENATATPSKRITVTEPQKDTLFSATSVTIKGTAEPFINLIVTGGKEEVIGDTDIDGAFTIPIELDPAATEHTLRVTDEFGEMDSGSFSVFLDIAKPEITSVSFTPEKPMEDTDVLMVVTAEPDLTEIFTAIGTERYQLEPAAGKPGTYQALLTAPAGGTYDVMVTATDSAGNSGSQSATLNVGFKGLPQVQNLSAKAETNGVTLQWDPIMEEAVDKFRIYVGETPTEFSFTLETNIATTAAQVAGLRPGTDYYFSVTALQGDRESTEKSNIVKSTVLGIRLDVVGQDGSLLLDWSSLRTDTSLTSFILEYGVEADHYTEQRILNGDLRTYMLRDLLNDVKYFVKLTPIDVTGKRMEDFATVGEGTPTSMLAGFRHTPADPAPINASLHAGAPPPPPINVDDMEETVDSGMPTFAWFAVVALAAGGVLFYVHRRQSIQTSAFLRAMEARYHQQRL